MIYMRFMVEEHPHGAGPIYTAYQGEKSFVEMEVLPMTVLTSWESRSHLVSA